MAGATCGAGYAHLSGTPDITPVFEGVHVVFYTYFVDFYLYPVLSARTRYCFIWMNGITI